MKKKRPLDFEDVKDWIMKYLMEPVYWFRRGLRRTKRFIAWFPVIWKDEDWDSAYLYMIMQFKISRIRKNMQKNARHLSCERNVKDMLIAEELLSRHCLNDFYYDNPKIYKPLCKCQDDELILTYDYTSSDSWFCEYCKKFGIKKWDKKEKDDFEYAMDLIKKQSKSWWD